MTSPVPAGRTLRFGDFILSRGRVTLASTGNSAAFDRVLLVEVAIWVTCYLAVRLAALRHVRRRRSIWFTPQVPHPRYMVRIAAIWGGIRLARDASSADVAFFFDDATVSPAPGGAAMLNGGCFDIAKSRVATVFADVFGYPLAVDPAAWPGDAVEKSEGNGTHDGRIVACPRPARTGFVYQRVIDTVADGIATDLRTQVVNGRVVAVWIKRRTASARFLPPNLTAVLRAPSDVFAAAEIAQIEAFATAMGADWAGLDVLRDAGDGRIYVVDVNKTDAGPIIALPLAAKLRSIAILADALTAMIADRASDQPSSTATSASTRASNAASAGSSG